MFIAFEGIDGSGKSTMSTRVTEYLINKGKDVLWTREPSEPYRSMIFDPNISDKEELLLFMADRARHINNVIKPAIDRGQIVITDRYILSSYAYQGYAKNNLDNCKIIDQIQSWLTEDFYYPDLVFILYLNPKKALARATDKNRFEEKGLDYFEKLSQFYSHQLMQKLKNTYLIDASRSSEEIYLEIITILENYLKD